MNVRRTLSFVAAVAITSVTVGALATLAHADEAGAAPQQVVTFGDLNLRSVAGVEVLYRRIERAAQDVCGPERRAGTRRVSEAWKNCVSESIYQAIQSINQPAVTAYYDGRLLRKVG